MSRRLSKSTVTILALVGCAVAAAAFAWKHRHDMPLAASRELENADQYELLSLYPYLSGPLTGPLPSSAEFFYGHWVLGRTLVGDPAMRRKLNDALREGAKQSDGRMMACFNPRHAIRVRHGSQVTDFVICFECRQVEVFRDGKQIAFFLTSASPQATFDQVLKDAGISPASQPR